MTERGVAALRADRDEILALLASLSTEEWEEPSACAGWRVQDVVAHLANTCRTVVDPGSLAPGVPGDLEATQAAQAEANRDWTPERVRADYASVSAETLEALEGFQAPGVASTIIAIEDAGRYPLHMVANALAFDHFCHLRNDILRPHGPIDRPSPLADELRVGATLEYLMAGLPQMSRGLGGVLTEPVGLRLSGPGGGEWTLARGDGGAARVEEAGDATTSILSSATDFIVWGTGRRSWRDGGVELVGDRDYAAAILDVIRLF